MIYAIVFVAGVLVGWYLEAITWNCPRSLQEWHEFPEDVRETFKAWRKGELDK